MAQVSLSDGRTVEFPDGMSQDDMAAALRKLPAAKSTGMMSNLAAGANEAVASTLGLPVDAMTGALNLIPRGINAVAGTNIPRIENPVGGSASIKSAMGLIGADPRNIAPADRAEEIARAGGSGVASAMMPGAVARALPQAAGPILGTIQGAMASGATPGAGALAGAAGMAGNVAEQAVPEPYKPAANMGAQLATGVGAGLAQRAGGGLLDAFLGTKNVTPERAAFARRMVDEYQLPLTAPDIQPHGAPMKWLQAGLDYLPFSGAVPRQAKLQEAVGRNLAGAIGGDEAGNAVPRLSYDVAAGASNRIGRQYDQALTNVNLPFMGEFKFNDLRNQIAQSTLTPTEQRALGMAMQNIERVARSGGGNLTGREYQGLRVSGSALDNLLGDANPLVSKFAREIKNALDANFGLAAPTENAALYNTTNQQYRNLMALKPEITKGEPGNITLGNIQNAANRAYPRRAFDEGPNVIGDMGDAAKTFLRRLPESGTAPRAGILGMLQSIGKGEFGPAAGYGVTGAAGVAGGAPGLLGVVGGGRAVNSALNSKWMREMLLNRVLNPQPAPTAIPPWMYMTAPATGLMGQQ